MPIRKRKPQRTKMFAKRRPLVTRAGRLARSQTMTVRMDPRLRYLAEIAARQLRLTLSSYMEWAVERSLSQVRLADSPDSTVAAEGLRLWNVNEVDRFVKLASLYPHLLDHDEQARWALIRETPAVWKDGTLDLELLRSYWNRFVAVARGEDDRSSLPRG